jgi:hypothetical protein
VETHLSDKKARELLDEKLTGLALLAKKLCPSEGRSKYQAV